MGMLVTMRKVDEDLLSQLGAVRMESPLGDAKGEIIESSNVEIQIFEVGLQR